MASASIRAAQSPGNGASSAQKAEAFGVAQSVAKGTSSWEYQALAAIGMALAAQSPQQKGEAFGVAS